MNIEEKIARELEKGETLIDLGYLDEALKRLDIVLELDNDNEEAWMFKCAAFERKGDFENALRCIDKVIEISPRNKMAWDYKGFLLYNLKEFENAINCFKKAIEINDKYINAYYNLACCYSLLEKKSDTLNTLKILVQLKPEIKTEIKNEKDFKWLYDEPDFINLVE
ncbi:MAG: tetratricopeptide repeat protein [Candidatus Helarchaeota archaeon]